MRWKTCLAAALAVFLVSITPGMAQEMGHAACAAMVAPPPALSGWTAKQPLTSATQAAGLDAAMLTPGKGAVVALHLTHEVAYVTQPEKPGGSVAHGGMLGLAISDPGTYQLSISSGAWIDVLKDGVAVMSSGHAPGLACTGIMKTVQFPLQPGRYVVQLSANAAPDIQVMVSKLP